MKKIGSGNHLLLPHISLSLNLKTYAMKYHNYTTLDLIEIEKAYAAIRDDRFDDWDTWLIELLQKKDWDRLDIELKRRQDLRGL